jgi:acetyl-CoA carboxylase biotin carboxyl carrier protein
VTTRRSPRGKKTSRPIVLPETFAGRSPADPLVSGNQTKQIQDLIDLLRRNNLTELELERQGVRIRIRHEVGMKTVTASIHDSPPASFPQGSQQSSFESQSSEGTAGLVTITSPIVGTFYRSPSPDADPYVEEGDLVKKGQVLCIVEAMKLMNEIESEVDGRIVKILAESTKSVEYGQALFLIDPKATA